jgi:hypothetical protein
VLNTPLFGQTTDQWCGANPGQKGNIKALLIAYQ